MWLSRWKHWEWHSNWDWTASRSSCRRAYHSNFHNPRRAFPNLTVPEDSSSSHVPILPGERSLGPSSTSLVPTLLAMEWRAKSFVVWVLLGAVGKLPKVEFVVVELSSVESVVE